NLGGLWPHGSWLLRGACWEALKALLLGNRHYTLLDDAAHPISSQAWIWCPLHRVPGSRAAGV
ncbi:hypothetical protein LEMLEM_LOCUS18991, partial [Lemmus lemmus]